jgi:preprotein translocase subunit YajC
MSNSELILFMAILPILLFMIIEKRNQKLLKGQRITTNILGLKGEVLEVAETHSRIAFNDQTVSWYRNSMFTAKD